MVVPEGSEHTTVADGGLTLAARIAQAHGGKLTVGSAGPAEGQRGSGTDAPETGCRVMLEIPVRSTS